MNIERIINTAGVLAVAHRCGGEHPHIDACPDTINPELLIGTIRTRDVAAADVELLVERKPFPLRIVVAKHGDVVVAVAIEQGSPVAKSLQRLIRRAANAKPVADVPPSTWVPPGASAPEPTPRITEMGVSHAG